MQQISSTIRPRHAVQTLRRTRVFLALLLGSVSMGGCGLPAEEASPELARHEGALEVPNGLSVNGLSVNGLSVNGLSVNGLSVNGLSVNGLSTQSFQGWFGQHSTLSDILMQYVVRCAMTPLQSLAYTHPGTGVSYHWQGQLGLAPGWSAGLPPSLTEQQAITACLAAHVNPFGAHVTVSMLGRDSLGLPLPYTQQELNKYSEPEGCFFGNAFAPQGHFLAATARPYLSESESSPRACGLASQPGSEVCAPIVHVGQCQDFCTLDETGKYYMQCTYGGVTYTRPVTTRIRPADIYTCGDGVCQFTESCGTGTTADSCAADCGACP